MLGVFYLVMVEVPRFAISEGVLYLVMVGKVTGRRRWEEGLHLVMVKVPRHASQERLISSWLKCLDMHKIQPQLNAQEKIFTHCIP
ncbi:hypothetical protein TNIN_483291 [Trichonephila inaurata madagascariensis]|uniref:Uncharacterized protein n=1 Tax=Trichonephila inaurata madagascariensis TaxID=2747483 RepID=A0A8X6Y4U4_9ARAC|nr:hypothetical protein TNIN_483291 [Trichonephila inaurata madagascariensis]